MLKGVSRALKGASPAVRVVAAGLAWPAVGVPADTYLSNLLRVPGVVEAIDVVAIHPYTRYVSKAGQEDVMDRVYETRQIMKARGAKDRRMWMTEIGWATGVPDGRFTVSEAEQRRNLDDLYRSLLSVRKSARLIGAAWFSFQDERVAPGHRDYWGFHNGLFRRDGSAKPAWRTLKLRALNGY